MLPKQVVAAPTTEQERQHTLALGIGHWVLGIGYWALGIRLMTND
ncbi:MAG: hypothetical protein RMZ69_09115 [Nostoc sp. ChiQUE01a]|nr:hypothetical protein [Nostoc sp. ChiQUE01a]